MKKNLRIIARATAEDKLILVGAIKNDGGLTLMSGDSIADAPSLKLAAVGMCMGKSGCSVAKENSDLVILDDNFDSIYTAIMWGRTLFENIRKYLQF